MARRGNRRNLLDHPTRPYGGSFSKGSAASVAGGGSNIPYRDAAGKLRTSEITVNGTRRILRGLHEFEFDVEQFIFSSTMLVHRPGEPGQFISEESPVDPTWAYPASKVRTEKVIHDERGDIPARRACESIEPRP